MMIYLFYIFLVALIWWIVAPLIQHLHPRQYQWYRAWRRGSWGKCTGLIYGQQWIRLGDTVHYDADEYYPPTEYWS